MTTDRRSFILRGTTAAAVLGIPVLPLRRHGSSLRWRRSAYPGFPRQDPERVQETVGASHGNFERVRQLVDASPALAKASWDWGFGDWESALGTAAHTGNADIAHYLIERGARPTLLSSVMLGHLETVRAMVEANPGVQGTLGAHGITLLRHARAGGDPARKVAEYLEAVGGADPRPATVALNDRRPYVGRYRFGPEEEDLIEITDDRDRLWFRRVNGSRRGLSHVGGHAFFPAGAFDVRIRFSMRDGRAARLEVYDPDPIVEAVRE